MNIQRRWRITARMIALCLRPKRLTCKTSYQNISAKASCLASRERWFARLGNKARPMEEDSRPALAQTETRAEISPRQKPVSLRGFWSLFVTQFQGAFSDNVLKNLVIFMILGLEVSLAKKHDTGELV